MKLNQENLTHKFAVRGITLGVALLMIGYAISDHPFYGGGPGFGGAQVFILALGTVLALCLLLPFRFNLLALLLYASASIALLIAELTGEVFLSPHYRSVYQADHKLIFKPMPGRHRIFFHQPINGGAKVEHRINQEGFRGEELKTAGSSTRILVYGDSFIHAYYTPDDETFTHQLQERLSRQLEKPIEVINAGVSSYGPDQISLKMEDELLKLNPDLVIVAIFAGNDYGDLMRNKLFKFSADGHLISNEYKLADDVRVRMELNQRGSILKRAIVHTFTQFRQQNPYAFIGGTQMDPGIAIMDFWLAEAKREYQDYIVDGSNVVTNLQQDHYSADISLQPDNESARYKIRLMKAVLQRIATVANKARVPLVFLFIPHPVNVAKDYKWVQIDTKRFPDYQPRNLIAPLESIALASSTHFVSLFDAYRQQDADQLYLSGGDDHWNAKGQKLAAELTADYLLEKGLLKENK